MVFAITSPVPFTSIMLAVGLGLAPARAQVLPEEDYHQHALIAAEALQQWYNPQGLWDTTGWWNAANCLDDLESVITEENGGPMLQVIPATYERNSGKHFLNDFYDDEGWWALAWLRAYDLTGDPRYLATAQTIFTDMTGGWDDHCGSGIWWKKDRHYKNAIANELFLLVAVRLNERTPGDKHPVDYLAWAQREWTWFQASGMINPRHLVNDGLNDQCENNHRTTWTYNQGVLIGGLTELYKVTGDPAYLAEASALAEASLAALTDAGGVLCEPREAERGLPGRDLPQFKGIFVRYLAGLYEVAGRPALRDFLVRNAQSVWQKDRDADNHFGGRWRGPVDTVDAARQSSALSLFTALAAPVTANCPFAAGAGGSQFNHQVGVAAGALAWKCDPTNATHAGYLLSGPFLASLSAGIHTVHFRLSLDALNSSAAKLVTLDVRENSAGTILASRDVAATEFTEVNRAQDFAVTFTNASPGDPLEFRAWWHNPPHAPALTLTDVTVDGFQNWTAANLSHEVGRLDAYGNWSVNPWQDHLSGCLVRGPGAAHLPPGINAAQFELKLDHLSPDKSTVATISVVDLNTWQPVALRALSQRDFPTVLWQTFPLRFNVVAGHRYDFRTFWRHSLTAPWLTQRCVVVRCVVVRSAGVE